MAQSLKVSFDDSQFVRSHGHSPRGRGSYAFSLEGSAPNDMDAVFFSPSMVLADAKKWAKVEAAKRVPAGVTAVYVNVLP